MNSEINQLTIGNVLVLFHVFYIQKEAGHHWINTNSAILTLVHQVYNVRG